MDKAYDRLEEVTHVKDQSSIAVHNTTVNRIETGLDVVAARLNDLAVAPAAVDGATIEPPVSPASLAELLAKIAKAKQLLSAARPAGPTLKNSPSANGNGRAVNGSESHKQEVRHAPATIAATPAIISWNDRRSRAGDQYRIIRTRIVQHPAQPKIIVISSAGPGDGKTISSINIAGILSLRRAKVLLVDADFRRAGVSSALGLPSSPGLANVLAGACGLADAILCVEQFPNLHVLPAGADAANPAELLDSERWGALCSTLRQNFSYCIVDAPPVGAVADYELIQSQCDGVIAVVRPDHTDRTLFRKSLDFIPERKRLGVVVNCAYEWFLWKTHESYYYNAYCE
jgi:capsular exopolysaccharide synthesis family protein